MLRSLSIVLIAIAFLPSLFSLVTRGVMGVESVGTIILVILLLLVLARNFMQYIMPTAAILIFLWSASGSTPGAFSALLSQVFALGIILLWFVFMFRIITGRRD